MPRQRSSSSSSEELEVELSRARRRREMKRQGAPRERQRGNVNHVKDNPRSADLNPSLSFKHFLQQNDNQPNHSYGGARPKVYVAQRPASDHNLSSNSSNVYPRNPTELPDFVQDHLVIEQCYMKQEDAAASVPDVDNLPDFALNSMEKRGGKKNDADLRFDLTDYLKKKQRDQISPNVSDPENDAPPYDRNNDQHVNSPEAMRFPFDLQVPAAELNSASHEANPEDRLSNSTPPNVTKTLPDFLNDGPIRNRGQMPMDMPGSNSVDSVEMRLRAENKMLRRELDIKQRLAIKRLSRIQALEAALGSRMANNHDESLQNVIKEVEDNLKRSTTRADNAESETASLQKEVDSLTNEVTRLRLENSELRLAMGLEDGECKRLSNDKQVACVAADLKAAASSAEMSLRQLMSGVSNLRILASTLENMNRIEDRTKEYLPDFDGDNAAGPAL